MTGFVISGAVTCRNGHIIGHLDVAGNLHLYEQSIDARWPRTELFSRAPAVQAVFRDAATVYCTICGAENNISPPHRTAGHYETKGDDADPLNSPDDL